MEERRRGRKKRKKEEERRKGTGRRNPSAQLVFPGVLSKELTENRLDKMPEILYVCFEEGVTWTGHAM